MSRCSENMSRCLARATTHSHLIVLLQNPFLQEKQQILEHRENPESKSIARAGRGVQQLPASPHGPWSPGESSSSCPRSGTGFIPLGRPALSHPKACTRMHNHKEDKHTIQASKRIEPQSSSTGPSLNTPDPAVGPIGHELLHQRPGFGPQSKHRTRLLFAHLVMFHVGGRARFAHVSRTFRTSGHQPPACDNGRGCSRHPARWLPGPRRLGDRPVSSASSGRFFFSVSVSGRVAESLKRYL